MEVITKYRHAIPCSGFEPAAKQIADKVIDKRANQPLHYRACTCAGYIDILRIEDAAYNDRQFDEFKKVVELINEQIDAYRQWMDNFNIWTKHAVKEHAE